MGTERQQTCYENELHARTFPYPRSTNKTQVLIQVYHTTKPKIIHPLRQTSTQTTSASCSFPRQRAIAQRQNRQTVLPGLLLRVVFS